MDEAEKIIKILNLEPHPEGGLFCQTYVDSENFSDKRKLSSLIYFLLKFDQYSHWHKVDATESWFWHAGSPLSLTISPNGHDASSIRLGPNVLTGEKPHFVVEKNFWQTAVSMGEWSLVSCLVTPAFSFDGFELAPENWYPTPRT